MTEFVEVKSNWMKWDKVGDSCEGVLVKTSMGKNTLKDPPCAQKNYVLVKEDGTSINIGGRFGDPMVISGLETVKIGQKVKVEFAEEGEKKPGKHAAKYIKVYEEGNKEIYQDIVNEFNGTAFVETEDTIEIE